MNNRLTIVGTCSTGNGEAVGGSGLIARRIFEECAHRGHRVHLVGVGGIPQNLSEGVSFHHVEAIHKTGLWPLQQDWMPLAERLAQVAIETDADVFHAHYLFPWGWAVWQAQQIVLKLTGKYIPTVVVPAGSDITEFACGPLRLTTKFLLDSFDECIVYTHGFLEVIEQTLLNIGLGPLARSPKVVYSPIPNFFVPVDKVQARQHFKIPQSAKVVGIAGNYRNVKHAPDGVRIFAKVRERINNAYLLLIGTGPELQECLDIASELGISEFIISTGRLENTQMPMAFSALDVLLQTSQNESFCLVLAEAGQCLVPSVATRVGGIPEVVEHDVTGLLVPFGNWEQYAQALIYLLENESVCSMMGAAARQKSLMAFSLERIVDQYEHVFRNVRR